MSNLPLIQEVDDHLAELREAEAIDKIAAVPSSYVVTCDNIGGYLLTDSDQQQQWKIVYDLSLGSFTVT